MTESALSSPTICPALGAMGGSAAAYVRAKDPMHRDAMPEHVRDGFPDVPRAEGWLAEDTWGNPIGFIPDGTPLRGYFMDARKLCESCHGRGHLLKDQNNPEHTGMANPCKQCGGSGETPKVPNLETAFPLLKETNDMLRRITIRPNP